LEGNTTLGVSTSRAAALVLLARISLLLNLQPKHDIENVQLSVLVDTLMAEEETKQVVSLIRKNYSLAVLDEGISAHDETGELGTLLKLNEVGRRYLINDAASIAKASGLDWCER
jgi:hypothetical protein